MISKQWKIALGFVGIFLVAYFLPLADPKVSGAIVLLVAGVAFYRQRKQPMSPGHANETTTTQPTGLPRMVDLDAGNPLNFVSSLTITTCKTE